MSTSLILVNLAGSAAAAACLFALCERLHTARSVASAAFAPALVLGSGMLGQDDQHAGDERKSGHPPLRRVSPLTERLTRSRDPIHRYREVTGRRARVRWWQRLRALVVLAVLVIILGLLVAVVVGIAFLAGTILLETVS